MKKNIIKIIQKIIILTLVASPLLTLAVGTVTTSAFKKYSGSNLVTLYGSASGGAGTLSKVQDILVNFGYVKMGPIKSPFSSSKAVYKDPKTYTCDTLAKTSGFTTTTQQKITAGVTPVQFSADVNMQPESVYYYCAIGADTGLTSYKQSGSVQKIETDRGRINTNPASNITKNSAVLNGFFAVPLLDNEDYVNFAYSEEKFSGDVCGKGYALETDLDTIFKVDNPKGEFQQKIIGLNPGTTYYACAVLRRNSTYPLYYSFLTLLSNYVYTGNIIEFTTLGEPSVSGKTKTNPNSANTNPNAASVFRKIDTIGKVTTYEMQNVSDTAALMRGSVSSVSGPAYAYFRYSRLTIPPVFCNDIYGENKSDVEAQNDLAHPVAGGKVVAGEFQTIAYNLKPDTEYYYCAVVSNSANNNPTEIKYGEVRKMRTAPCKTCDKISIATNEPRDILPTSALLKGAYNTNVELETYFEYKENVDGGAVGAVLGGGTTLSSTDWIKVNQKEKHAAKSYGKVNYTLTGLKQDTEYFVRLVGRPTNGSLKIIYGETIRFKTKIGSDITIDQGPTEEPEIPPISVDPGIDTPVNPGNGGPFNPYNPNNGGGSGGGSGDLNIGTVATPPDDALVHYREGVETVFQRQIVKNSEIQKYYGYETGEDLQIFGWRLAHDLAYEFGYVDGRGREIRVSTPDVSAYEIRLNGNGLTVYEYYKGVIIDIRTTSFSFKLKNQYEYYFRKVLRIFQ